MNENRGEVTGQKSPYGLANKLFTMYYFSVFSLAIASPCIFMGVKIDILYII